jgi:cell division protease FtsH
MAGTLVSLEAVDGPGRGNLVAKVLADEVAARAVEQILDQARAEVRTLLADRRYLVAALRDALLDRDELIGHEIGDILIEAEEKMGGATVDLRDQAALTD